MAHKPILNTIPNELMQKNIAQKNAQRILISPLSGDKAYQFIKHNNALYINIGEENFRVLDFTLGENQNGARDISLKFTTSNYDIETFSCGNCKASDAETFIKTLKNYSVNLGVLESGNLQNPLLLSKDYVSQLAIKPTPQTQKKKEKSKNLWPECLKDWAQMGIQISGGLLVTMTLIGVFTSALAGWLFILGLVAFSFPNQIINLGEKGVKKVFLRAGQINNWLDYRLDLREYKRHEKDFWAHKTKNHQKVQSTKQKIQENAQKQSKIARMKHFSVNKIKKFSKKKPLHQIKNHDTDLIAGM